MANHITTLRNKIGIKTASECAKILNISNNMMYFMEQGLKKPSPQLALKMKDLFNCTLDDIFLPYFTTNSNNKQ